MEAKNKLGNPVAVAAAATASNPEVIKASKEVVINYTNRAMSTAKVLVGIAATGITVWYLNKKYKEWRKQKFVEQNAHIPDVQVAMIFRRSMFRIEFNDFPWNLISIPDGTDVATLNKFATKISSMQNVIKAYKILFDSNLITDVYSELNNKELQTFFDRINANGAYNEGFDNAGNPLPQIPLRIGETIEIKNPNGATVYRAEKTADGKFKNSRESADFIKFGKTVGTIIAVYKSTTSAQHYYVVDRYLVIDTLFGYGWIQHTDVRGKS